MARLTLCFPWLECGVFLGVLFGGWLIQQAFQPASDLPNRAILILASLDLLLCFYLLGYRLRCRLHAGEGLPRYWLVTGAVSLACYLGWIAALLIDADRVSDAQAHHREYDQQIAKLLESVNHLGDLLPANQATAEKNAWQTNYDGYHRLHDQLQTMLRPNPAWATDLARVNDQVDSMHKLFLLFSAEPGVEQRTKWRGDFQAARTLGVQQANSLRGAIAQGERDLAITHRIRWQSLGSAAMTGVILVFGALLLWIIFDRELRRTWRRHAKLATDEARYRALVEQQTDALAVLDVEGNINYVNPAWQKAFGYDPADLINRNFFELIHADDRMRARLSPAQTPIACRFSADYGIWHDVEIRSQPPADDGTTIVRVHDLRETQQAAPPKPSAKPAEVDPRLQQQQDRIAELQRETALLRDRDSASQRELDRQRWLLEAHQQANSEGVLLLSPEGELLSANPAFARIWKLSKETLAGHSWQTIAAHMESLARTGWDDFRRLAMSHDPAQSDTCWEMTLEGSRTIEVYAQVQRDQAAPRGALQFHFRDVTKHKELEASLRDQSARAQQWEKSLRDHEDKKKSHEAALREHEKKVKHLEKQLRERDQQHEELESALRDHQERLHGMHDDHAAATKSNKETMHRFAAGVANEVNNVLSVVLGNADVLHENLPKDHVAQNYVDEIRQAGSRGTDLAQRLLAFSRNHLTQMAPTEMNQLLATLEAKVQQAIGHDIHLDWRRDAAESWVKIDPHSFEQALLNLVGQTRQHRTAGSTLTIRTARVELAKHELTHAGMMPGAYVAVRIQDNGDTFTEDTLAHLFEPYYPIKEGTKGDLSLATAYGILRQNGGSVDVESDAGKGNEWIILLPETSERPQALRASA